MLIKNKTASFQKCAGKAARPWRTIEVPDNAQVNEKVFEIVGKKKEFKKKVIKKESE